MASDQHVVANARARYAREIADGGGVPEAMVAALATVPRERFLGPGPWKILRPPTLGTYEDTPDADPCHLYANVLVAIDADRRLNNGEPASLVRWIASTGVVPGARFLHVGCGVGYYTAVAAETVGSEGRVVGIEVDANLAARAKQNLARYENTRVVSADGSHGVAEAFDAVFVNAGATEVRDEWLAALDDGATLLMPLTVSVPSMGAGIGYMLEIVRSGGAFAARFVSPVAIFHCTGARTEEGNDRLERAYRDGAREAVRSLRRDSHAPAPDCWLHGQGWCLSTNFSTSPVGG